MKTFDRMVMAWYYFFFYNDYVTKQDNDAVIRSTIEDKRSIIS